ncbi:MAG: rRNA maturation RNase YbeY [Bacteroidia bacterium]|nr:rRNA maturation RNase YbeY [Bacteroidia bacterium]
MRRASVYPVIRFHGFRGELREARRHREWLQNCWRLYMDSREPMPIEYWAVSLETIADLHGRFLGNTRPTDILTFDYGDMAEIFVCLAVIKENARLYRTTFSNELRRVLVHGILHLCGLNDDSDSARCQMREAEDLCLSAWAKTVSHETIRPGF